MGAEGGGVVVGVGVGVRGEAEGFAVGEVVELGPGGFCGGGEEVEYLLW